MLSDPLYPCFPFFFLLIHRFHSISFTRAQGIPKYCFPSPIGPSSLGAVSLILQHSFWPPVDILGCVGPSAGACSYFLNLGKPTGLPILVFMPAGVGATALEDRSDADTVEVRGRCCGCTFSQDDVGRRVGDGV